MNSLSLSDMAQAPVDTSRHHRLIRLSGFASWASFASAMLIVVATACLWLFDGALSDWLAKSVDGILVTPSSMVLAAAGGVAMVPIALLVAMLVELGRLFRLFAANKVFDPAVPRRLGRVGWLAFSSCAATVVCKTLVILLMTSANPPGHHILSIGVDSQALAGLMFGFLFLVFSLVMQEALGLAEENRSFV
ncbi:DUF2975 domain-containing protein [Pleomorphomonas oryzae]|uniref:DUF2975 domain-containing protein n=1 Tax=Pleomorphomonas oryzae TaxID=261934 RepID=UPI0009FE401E|nr:DUF2975 domain-containing protein [Pleomorphomonas oryzae]